MRARGAGPRRAAAAERGRVLYITYDGVLEPSAFSQVLPYVKRLSDQGWRFTLLSFEKPLSHMEASRAEQIRNELAVYEVRWVQVRYHKRPRLAAKIYDLLIGSFKALRLALTDRIQLIHCRSTMAAFIGLLPSLLPGRKLFYDTRGLLSDQYVAGGLIRRTGILPHLVREVEYFLLRRADATAVHTTHDARRIRRMGILSRPVVMPSFIDTQKFRLPTPQERAQVRKRFRLRGRRVLCYMGRVGTWYLFPDTVDFMAEAARASVGLQVLILSPDPPQLIAPVLHERGLTSRSRIVSALPEEVPSLLPACDAGVFFIRTAGKEGCSPIKLGEFLAGGIPVVVNRGVGETEDLVREEGVGVVIDRLHPDAYRKGIEELKILLKEPSAVRRRCRAAAVRRLDLGIGVRRYAQTYERLLHARAGRSIDAVARP